MYTSQLMRNYCTSFEKMPDNKTFWCRVLLKNCSQSYLQAKKRTHTICKWLMATKYQQYCECFAQHALLASARLYSILYGTALACRSKETWILVSLPWKTRSALGIVHMQKRLILFSWREFTHSAAGDHWMWSVCVHVFYYPVTLVKLGPQYHHYM